MTNNTHVTMLVCWKQQRRLINLKSDDDLNTIKKSIINIYHLQQINQFDEYQIQYYDEIYKKFIDLYSETIQQFQELVQKFLVSNASSNNKNIRRLRIVPKAIETIRDTSPVHTYDSLEDELINSPIDDTTLSSNSSKFDGLVTNKEDLHETVTSQIINPMNEFNFHFEEDIADRQRKQYESDISRRKTSNSLSTGGVFLRALNFDGTVAYPKLQFHISENKRNSSWYLYLYILTECDTNGDYYLHASKGIFDNKTITEEKFGPIPNSNLVNPYKIQLSENDIQQGKYEIRLRVCNIRNLPIHKHEKLRKFPELDRFMMYDDDNLISKFTTADLNFSSEKYHLGCILVWDHKVQDRCISRLAKDDNKRKRK